MVPKRATIPGGYYEPQGDFNMLGVFIAISCGVAANLSELAMNLYPWEHISAATRAHWASVFGWTSIGFYLLAGVLIAIRYLKNKNKIMQPSQVISNSHDVIQASAHTMINPTFNVGHSAREERVNQEWVHFMDKIHEEKVADANRELAAAIRKDTLQREKTKRFDEDKVIPPSIIIGQKEPYKKITTEPNGELVQRIYVGVKNNRIYSPLHNLQLYMDSYRYSEPTVYCLQNTFDLSPQQERYVEVATYPISNFIVKSSDYKFLFWYPPHILEGHQNPPGKKEHEKNFVVLRLETFEKITIKISRIHGVSATLRRKTSAGV